MRAWRTVWAVALMVGVADAEGAWRDCEVPLATTGAWHAVRAEYAPQDAGLAFSSEDRENGFIFARDAKPRQTVRIEADVRVGRRLVKQGWSFAGVSLYQDDAHYWMVALVEGPDGSHSVDFLEKHAGVWQAQSQGPTELKREGTVSFAWRSGAVYRLQLSLESGRVLAKVCESESGRVCGTASFTLGTTPAVRCGRPALVAHGTGALCGRFLYAGAGRNEPKHSPSVALFDEALPGHDREANARLAAALSARGLQVSCLPSNELLAPGRLTADAFDALIVPQCDAVQADWAGAVRRFAAEGGHVVFLGGPFLDRGLVNVKGKWLDPDGLRETIASVLPQHRPFVIGPSLDLKGWRRACMDTRVASSLRVASEGPDGADCLRVDIADLQGWDVRHSPSLASVFGEGDAFFTFQGKGDASTTQLAIEITERDGSRWIATAPLSSTWRRVGLRLDAFRYWKDSGAKGRGGAGDRLNPRETVRVGFGLSSSHTSAVGPGAHTFWLADIGTAPDPVVSSGAEADDERIECVYPRYKVHSVGAGAVCAIPRTEGEGFNRGARWRFVPLREVSSDGGKRSGVCEWLLLNTRFPLEGSVTLGFGYTDPSAWSSPETAGRIADAVSRVTSGALFESAGTEQFAYWPGEPVKLGARVRRFGVPPIAPCEVSVEVTRDERVVWRERASRALSGGANDFNFVWQPPAVPGEYRVTFRLSGDTPDVISHGFAVLDPAPAPRSSFITAHDGNFWLKGDKWYPVGLNFWPLYVSGMDQADYWPGWLRDAYYAPSLVERDLAQLRDMGVNMVSIQTPPVGESRNLLDFLRLCGHYGIHVNVYVGLASPLAFDDAGLKGYLETAKLPGNATVFAYDTIWEPGNHVFKDKAARARWDAEWRAWIDERYGSLERAEKDWGCKARRDSQGLAVSPDDICFREDGAWRGMMSAYRRFMDSLTSHLWGRANRRLRELDPNHLVSFRQGNTLPYDFALSGPVKHIDFICPEGYSIRDTDEGEDAIGFITRYVDFTTGGKPIVWSEFGMSVWDNGRMAADAGAIERQGHYSERFYRTALAAGANGTVPWWWVGGYRVDERSDFGIVSPDRGERPAARLIREYGPKLKTPRVRTPPGAWFDFDRDAHAGGYWRAAFHEGAAAYRAAAGSGQALGVRTSGTGRDSADVPLVALGDVPCDGTNPPKYLDAEFNALQVLNAGGVWQEAEDGAEISVSAGEPVRLRASVGNTQEAAWLPGTEKGDVTLTAREGDGLLGRWPVAARVPYLGDAEFAVVELLPAARSASVTVRMEALGRTPFGEARSFTLRVR